MNGNVSPTPNTVLGRILPCLKTIAIIEIVKRLPVVESLIAILNWCVEGGYYVRRCA